MSRVFLNPPQRPHPVSPTTSLPDVSSETHALLERLTSQLDSVLQTVDTLIQTNSDFAQLDISHTKQILGQLNERLNPGATNQTLAPPSQNYKRTCDPTQKKTYAEATSAATTKRFHWHHKKIVTKPAPPRRTNFGSAVQQVPSDKIKNILNDRFAVNGNTVR